MAHEGKVYVVDDDAAVGASLKRLTEEVGLRCEVYGTADEFMAAFRPNSPACLVLDVRLPGMSGLALHAQLAAAGLTIPVIMISGHGDIPMATDVVRRGALDFLEKPVNPQQLLDRIQEALARDAETQQARARREAIASRVALLTTRERQVVDLAITGLTNKQIAAQLGVSPQAVDAQRAKAMRKLDVDTIPDLVRVMLEVGDA
jgi:two-component system response regulator FixJ